MISIDIQDLYISDKDISLTRNSSFISTTSLSKSALVEAVNSMNYKQYQSSNSIISNASSLSQTSRTPPIVMDGSKNSNENFWKRRTLENSIDLSIDFLPKQSNGNYF
jgi:hypothetical protein